ncbi:MAG: hypothetical protein AB1540_14725 [Bdellovibrionota bacterium]
MTQWPKDQYYRERFFVPDLTPEQRSQLKKLKPKLVFVAESPHESEVAPEMRAERRPLCGKAGREWWQKIGQILKDEDDKSTELGRLLELCLAGDFAVMNAVQYPLDPKITLYQGEEAAPVRGLGFSKVSPYSYKKLKDTEAVRRAVQNLRERLNHSSLVHALVVSLGNDAQWFVNQALQGSLERHLETIPHPSAWWRQGGKLRTRAELQLTSLLGAARTKPAKKQALFHSNSSKEKIV